MTDTKTDNTALTDLIQLPDGNWIDPATITRIQHAPPSTSAGRESPDQVMIWIGDSVVQLRFDDAIAATEFRDKLAYKVNAAKAALRMREMQPGGLPGQEETFHQMYERVMRKAPGAGGAA